MKSSILFVAILTAVLVPVIGRAQADFLELKEGTVYENCCVRDEGTRLLVWESMEKVGTTDDLEIPRSKLAPRLTKGRTVVRKTKNGEVERVENQNPLIYRKDEWHTKPQLPDISITYIEMNPKLAGLHGKVQYERLGARTIGGAPVLDKRAAGIGRERIP